MRHTGLEVSSLISESVTGVLHAAQQPKQGTRLGGKKRVEEYVAAARGRQQFLLPFAAAAT